MERRISTFALAGTFLVLAPWCGSLLALACPADCCCGHSALDDSCQDRACIQSPPATVADSALVMVSEIPVAATFAAVTAHVGIVAASELTGLNELAPAHSPPKLFLQNACLLI